MNVLVVIDDEDDRRRARTGLLLFGHATSLSPDDRRGDRPFG
jgi:hypothetical protein